MKILDCQKPKFNIDRVMRERQILAQSNHRNVVKMIYSFQEKDLFYMVLEFHSRGNLNGLIDEYRTVHGQRGDALSEPLVRKILMDVIDALDYLHSTGVAHRDLKPENLLVAEDGRIILADFGLASVHTPISSENIPQERMTHPLGSGVASELRASSVGSPLYRAPETFTEVLRKTPLPPYSTHLTDMWSLGIMAHELLTGTFALNKMVAPNDIDDMKELVREMRAYVSGTRPIFWPADVSVSRQAKSLVEQLLQPNPFARPSLDMIKSHPFFFGVDWQNLSQYRAQFVPVGPQTTAVAPAALGSLNVPAALLRGMSFVPSM
jgi:protein-serine/threonine kinase